MYIHQLCMKDGFTENFVTDGPYPPTDYFVFYKKRKDEIENVYCDHYTGMSVVEFLNGKDDHTPDDDTAWHIYEGGGYL